MSYQVDYKYVNIISSKLERFSWKKSNLAIARCPLCGDSEKNKLKRRLYFFEYKDHMTVKCHNCGYASSFSNFLKDFDNNTYKEYTLESFFGDKKKEKPVVIEDIFKSEEPIFNKTNLEKALDTLKNINEVNKNSEVFNYIVSRKIPLEYYAKLYYTENFNEFCKIIDPSVNLKIKEARLVIPFYDKNNRPFMVQGRSLEKESKLRYISIREPGCKIPKIYGLEKIDFKKPGFLVEGPIDSMFLNNAIAVAGSDLNLNGLDNFTIVFDNEPRNREILSKYRKVIKTGKNICIWPENINQKDINDMILNGLNPQQIIEQNTYSGIKAYLVFNKWRKV